MTVESLFDRLREHRLRGEAVGLCSVCSSHPLVIEAAIRIAKRTGSPFLVEATANQVNQNGGYTGLVPGEFAVRLRRMCDEHGVDHGRIVFGGDHLGPYPWRVHDACSAMAEAQTLVRAFIRAGAQKIHLDASMPCGDDSAPLALATAAERTAALCAAAEDEWMRTGQKVSSRPVYVIGSEVPLPGGDVSSDGQVRNGRAPAATRPEDLRETIETHEHLFHESGLDDAWSRVIAVVVHPGIEFNALRVFPYSREAATGLRETLKSFPGLFLEGHSTDYQSTPSLRALVEDGFAVLKVGPELTFTLREQLFSLERIEQEMVDAAVRSRLRETVLAAMTEDPKPWRGYYAEGPDLSWSMTYAYSDRARYYWEVPKVARSVRRLLSNLEEAHVPLPLISQHIPHLRPAADLIECTPTELVLQGIEGQLERYVIACGSVRLAGEG